MGSTRGDQIVHRESSRQGGASQRISRHILINPGNLDGSPRKPCVSEISAGSHQRPSAVGAFLEMGTALTLVEPVHAIQRRWICAQDRAHHRPPLDPETRQVAGTGRCIARLAATVAECATTSCTTAPNRAATDEKTEALNRDNPHTARHPPAHHHDRRTTPRSSRCGCDAAAIAYLAPSCSVTGQQKPSPLPACRVRAAACGNLRLDWSRLGSDQDRLPRASTAQTCARILLVSSRWPDSGTQHCKAGRLQQQQYRHQHVAEVMLPGVA